MFYIIYVILNTNETGLAWFMVFNSTEDKNSLQDAVGDLIDKRHREERDLLIQVWFNAIIILIRNLRVLCTLNL
jgi:hypothetical protein